MTIAKRFRREVKLARSLWNELSQPSLLTLLETLRRHHLSIASGDLLLIDGSWYITHAGLLKIAARKQCRGIHTQPVTEFCETSTRRYAFRATVYTSSECKGFVGHGDADPSNVSPLVHGAEMRVAETRAVNRALRKAYGIGICSIEEIGTFAGPGAPVQSSKKTPPQPVNGNLHPTGSRVRDRLCQLIRQHQLDPGLVKLFAVDFCGTKTLRDATRAQVENFVVHLADWAEKDRNALLCQLNSYMGRKEGAA
jgi:hypothetical protein